MKTTEIVTDAKDVGALMADVKKILFEAPDGTMVTVEMEGGEADASADSGK